MAVVALTLPAAGCAGLLPGVGGAWAPVPGRGADTGQVDVYIANDATPAQIAGLRARLETLEADGTVASFRFISAEEALAELRGRLDDPTILDDLPSNPLPSKFEVETAGPEVARRVVSDLRGAPGLDPALGVRGAGVAP